MRIPLVHSYFRKKSLYSYRNMVSRFSKGSVRQRCTLPDTQPLGSNRPNGIKMRPGMSLSEDYAAMEDLHPIDIVETLAEHHAWEFDRVTDDQIAMAVEGQWRTYSLTLAWSAQDETLRLICTFEMEPPEEKIGALYDVLNRCNDMVWSGAFTWWSEQKLMVWRYGLVLSGGQVAGPEQIDRLIAAAVMASERFYPAFQLVSWGDQSPAEAMKVAIAEAYGRA